MNGKTLFVIVVLSVMALCNVNPSFSQDKTKEVVVDLNTLDCRSLLRMSGSERDFTVTFYHGLLSGLKQEMVFNGPVLAKATDEVIDHCIENPNDPLLKVFKAKRP